MPKSEFYPGFYEPDGIKPLSGPDTIKYVQEKLGQTKILLSFSCGKDSVALWLTLREHFEIIPFYLYRIPGISFVEDSLGYYEDFFGQEIVRLPHPTFYRMLANHVWQPPQRVGWIEAMNLKRCYFYPIWDVNMAALLGMLGKAKIKLAIDYHLFGRSFDGMDYRFMKPIKENYPADWELIKEWFPFVEMEILRYSAHEH